MLRMIPAECAEAYRDALRDGEAKTLATTVLGIDRRFTDDEIVGMVDACLGATSRTTASTPDRIEILALTAERTIPGRALPQLQNALHDREDGAAPARAVTIRREDGTAVRYTTVAK